MICSEQTSAQPLAIGSRLELFVDDYLIDRMEGVRRKLHEPRLAGTVMKFDQPWEGGSSGYATIIKDGDGYRMFYRGRAIRPTRSRKR